MTDLELNSINNLDLVKKECTMFLFLDLAILT